MMCGEINQLRAESESLREACAAMRTQLRSVLWCSDEGIGQKLSPMVYATFTKCVEMADAALGDE
jgi:hypothetical protein